MRHRRPAATLWLFVGLSAALAAPTVQAGPGQGATGAPELAPVPPPDVSGLEPAVRALLEATLRRVAGLAADDSLDAADKALAYGEAGEVFQAHSLFEQALACYGNAERLATTDPADPRWPYLAGYVHQGLGRLDSAREDYERALAAAPGNPLGRFRIAEMLMLAGDHTAAREMFRGLVDEPGLRAASAADLGVIELGAGEIRQAIEHLERALELQPGADQLHYPLAAAYRQLGRTAEAERHARLAGTGKAVPADPWLREVTARSVSSEAYLALGLDRVEAQDFAGAVEAYREAVRLNPDNKRAHLNLAVSEMRLGRMPAAEEELRRALALDPDYPQAHLNLGILREDRSELAAAAEHYERALAGDPDGVEVNFRVAGLAMRRGDYPVAVEGFRKVVRLAPAMVQARYLEALALLALDRPGEAADTLDAAVELAPERPDLRRALARAIATGPVPKPEQAERALALAGQLYAEQPSAEDAETLAMALAAAGRFDEAVRLQEQVLAAAGAGEEILGHVRHNLDRYRAGERADRAFP